MTDAIFWIACGVVGGWVFLPEPAIFRNMWAKIGLARPAPLYDPLPPVPPVQ
jgi:hypothetical protein